MPIQVWVKPQPGGKLAVYIVNPTTIPPTPTIPPALHIQRESTASSDSLAAPPTDPLSCFTEEPDSAKQPNVCNGGYQVKLDTNTSTECATKCLADPKCLQFVKATPTYGDPHACRLSYTCVAPTSYLAGFDGFLRHRTAECGSKPAPPVTPVTVTVDFSTLGLGSTVMTAGVRDIWAKKDIADATGAVLTAVVAPEDSAFFVLTPK
jgi:hypothetical protein